MICDRKVPLKLKGIFYHTTIRSVMLYGTECWIVKSQQEIKCHKDENVTMIEWLHETG